jgi:hypothetical protein
MTASIRRMTRPDTVWYHHNHPATTWSALRKMFAPVGGITVARAILLGWSTSEANAHNPVNVMLGG